jgi:hypothetical protein
MGQEKITLFSDHAEFINGDNLYTVQFFENGIKVRKTNFHLKDGMKITPEVSNVIRIV